MCVWGGGGGGGMGTGKENVKEQGTWEGERGCVVVSSGSN